jgi:signal transduction histidine kinase
MCAWISALNETVKWGVRTLAPDEVLSSLTAVIPLVLSLLGACRSSSGEISPRSLGREEDLVAMEKKLAVMKEMLQEQSAALRRAEEEVERLKKLLRRGSAPMLQVVHELRAPIASIQSCLDVLLQGYSTIPAWEQEAMLQLARDRAKASLGQVNDLLYLGGIRHAEVEKEVQPVQLVDALWRVAPEMRIKAMLRGVDLHLDAPDALPLVAAADEHMGQLLYNLIDNAIKYTDPEGSVTVSLKEGTDCVVGEVEDTGIGIAPDDMSRVFDEFYRCRNAKEVEPYGTGLGLPIVKRVVELYNGHLHIESELNKGSRFVFTLPRIDVTPSSTGEERTKDTDVA